MTFPKGLFKPFIAIVQFKQTNDNSQLISVSPDDITKGLKHMLTFNISAKYVNIH